MRSLQFDQDVLFAFWTLFKKTPSVYCCDMPATVEIKVKFCLRWSIGGVYPKKHDVNCNYFKIALSNTIVVDMLPFTSFVIDSIYSIYQQKKRPKNTSSHTFSCFSVRAPPPARLLHPSAAVQRLTQNLLMDPGALQEHKIPRRNLAECWKVSGAR